MEYTKKVAKNPNWLASRATGQDQNPVEKRQLQINPRYLKAGWPEGIVMLLITVSCSLIGPWRGVGTARLGII